MAGGRALGRMSAVEENMSVEEYIEQKIKMLKNEFCLRLTFEDIEHFNSLKTKSAVDQYAHKLFVERL